MNCKTCSANCCLKGSNIEGECEGYKPTTHYEKIQRMSIEEMATFGVTYSYCPPGVGCLGKSSCKKCWLDWLKQDIQNDENKE